MPTLADTPIVTQLTPRAEVGQLYPARIVAFQGRLAWSNYDEATKRYRLITYNEGETSVVPIAPRQAPFDVDLGPGPNGQVVAVYSRCAKEALTPLDLPQRHSKCDLYRFDFASGQERKLVRASSRAASEFSPTVWGRTIAFARLGDRLARNSARSASLLAGRVDGRGGFARLPGGATRTTGSVNKGERQEAADAGPSSMDLRGRQLAFTWIARNPAGCCLEVVTELRVDTLGGRGRRVTYSRGGLQAPNLFSASISGGDVYALFDDFSRKHLIRQRLGGSKIERAQRFPSFSGIKDPSDPYWSGAVLSAAPDGERLYYSAEITTSNCKGTSDDDCALRHSALVAHSDPPAFRTWPLPAGYPLPRGV